MSLLHAEHWNSMVLIILQEFAGLSMTYNFYLKLLFLVLDVKEFIFKNV